MSTATLAPKSATPAVSFKDRVEDLQNYIRTGRILEAMSEFYAPNVSMQENNAAPVVGLDTNIEREKKFLANVKQFLGYEVRSLSLGTDASGTPTAAVESTLRFIAQDNTPVTLNQVSLTRWQNNKITAERFYYGA